MPFDYPTQKDLQNMYLDCNHIAEVATGKQNGNGAVINTSTDRLGQVKRTLPAILSGLEDTGASLFLTNYTALRNYTGTQNTVQITGYHDSSTPSGIAGLFVYDPTDTTSADNGGTIIVDTSNRRWKRQYDGIVNALWFNVKGDGKTNNTAAMQAAHNTGKIVYYPAGRYKFSTITITTGGIIGNGKSTILDSIDTTNADLITYTGGDSTDLLVNELGAVFCDFYLRVEPTQKIYGAGIRLDPTVSGNENYSSVFSGITVRNVPTGIYTTLSSWTTIRDCIFSFYSLCGIYEDNNNALWEDNGDNFIIGNSFYTSHPCAVGIKYRGGGGRILGNKINLGQVGIDISPLRSSSIVLIQGNSIEGQTISCIRFTTEGDAVATAFGEVSIIGNQLNGYATTGSVVQIQPTTYTLTELIVSGNTCRYFHNSGNAIDIRNTTRFVISGNQLEGNNLGYRGIYTHSNTSDGKIYGNSVQRFSSIALINGTNVEEEKFVQYETVNITANTPYGPLYIGYKDIKFDVAYRTTPNVMGQVNDASNGGISIIVNNVTTTGFRFYLVTYANGGMSSCSWRAEGVLP